MKCKWTTFVRKHFTLHSSLLLAIILFEIVIKWCQLGIISTHCSQMLTLPTTDVMPTPNDTSWTSIQNPGTKPKNQVWKCEKHIQVKPQTLDHAWTQRLKFWISILCQTDQRRQFWCYYNPFHTGISVYISRCLHFSSDIKKLLA